MKPKSKHRSKDDKLEAFNRANYQAARLIAADCELNQGLMAEWVALIWKRFGKGHPANIDFRSL